MARSLEKDCITRILNATKRITLADGSCLSYKDWCLKEVKRLKNGDNRYNYEVIYKEYSYGKNAPQLHCAIKREEKKKC